MAIKLYGSKLITVRGYGTRVRQAYIHYRKFSWYPKHLYEKYTPIIGSATAQQIVNKNNEALWNKRQ